MAQLSQREQTAEWKTVHSTGQNAHRHLKAIRLLCTMKTLKSNAQPPYPGMENGPGTLEMGHIVKLSPEPGRGGKMASEHPCKITSCRKRRGDVIASFDSFCLK